MLLKGKEFNEIAQRAKREGWGIGAFFMYDYNCCEAIISAAEELGTPIMALIADFHDPNLAEGNFMSERDTENFLSACRNRIERATVPIAYHLDHCTTFGGCARAIAHGATSVMIDASMKSFEENIAATQKVKELCDASGVCLEAEIGHVTGHANSAGAVYTEVRSAKEFYDRTKVELLAVSIGTVHGVYKSEPVLNYDRIAELNAAIPAALVMHGGSGLTPEQFEKCVSRGIVKINVATYMQLCGGEAIRQAVLKAQAGKVTHHELVEAGHRAMVDWTKKHIGYFQTKPL